MDQRMYNGGPWEPQTLQDQVRELRDLLELERHKNQSEYNTSMQLSRELEETKRKLAYQKAKTESFIHKEKSTRKELERLKELSDPETMRNMMLATQVHNKNKTKKKKVLQKEHDDLKLAHILSQEKFAADLLAEKDQNQTLQEEVDYLRLFNIGHRAQLLIEREKSDKLQRDIRAMSEAMRQLVTEELETVSST